MEGVWHARAHTQSHFHYSHPLESRRDTSPAPAKDMFERIPEENHPPQCVALLISESPFTQTTLRRAFSSTVPLLLLYLPPYTPNTAAGLLSDPILPPPTFPVIGAAYPNPTLAQLTAPLEIRWERPNHLEDAPMSAGCGRPGLWLDGQRISSWIN
ncbi:hypothetical protein ID866_11004 [Astraeus odoratus]|nr:hypothetical protein ID866_11004 [Astraeus odoratus]